VPVAARAAAPPAAARAADAADAAASADAADAAPADAAFTTLYRCAPGAACADADALVNAAYALLDDVDGGGGGNATRACRARVSAPAAWSVRWPGEAERAAGAAPAAAGAPPRCVELGYPFSVALRARDAGGAGLCAGGDYVEAALAGARVRARPRTTDYGNGSYALEIFLPDDELLVGEAELSARVLFRALGGLARASDYAARFGVDAVALPAERLRLVRAGGCGAAGVAAAAAAAAAARGAPPPPPLAPPAARCDEVDFTAAPFWDGHWVAQDRGAAECAPGACFGSPAAAALRADWVYRLRGCAFALRAPAAARGCLDGGWLFSSGDSTALDSLGNLLNSTLALDARAALDVRARDASHVPSVLPKGRSFDARGPWAPAAGGANMSFRATNIWNAAPAEAGLPEDQCCHGVAVISNGGWRGRHEAALRAAPEPPSLLIVNSGLHDGMRYSLARTGLRDYASDVEILAAPFWDSLGGWAARDGARCAPSLVWRATLAPAGTARTKRANPQFVEIMNRIVAGALLRGAPPRDAAARRARGGCAGGARAPDAPGAAPRWQFIDAFDMSFPWHFTNQVSDGGHYGRHHCDECAHVDIFMQQVLLNGVCDV
jgi:hypothetical protein